MTYPIGTTITSKVHGNSIKTHGEYVHLTIVSFDNYTLTYTLSIKYDNPNAKENGDLQQLTDIGIDKWIENYNWFISNKPNILSDDLFTL